MPPSGFSKKAIAGVLIFLRACYKDLLEDVKTGKFKTYEEAIQYEIDHIGEALYNMNINDTTLP